MATKIDWDRIEIDYCAGIKSLRQIAAEHDLSHASIQKHAKKYNWERDLTARIRVKANALVAKREATKQANKSKAAEIVQESAEKLADVQVAQRSDVPKKRALVNKLFTEIEELTGNRDLVEQIEEALKAQDQKILLQAVKRVTSLTQRISNVDRLVSAYKTLIDLERKVYRLDEPGGVGDPDAPEAIILNFHREGPVNG